MTTTKHILVILMLTLTFGCQYFKKEPPNKTNDVAHNQQPVNDQHQKSMDDSSNSQPQIVEDSTTTPDPVIEDSNPQNDSIDLSEAGDNANNSEDMASGSTSAERVDTDIPQFVETKEDTTELSDNGQTERDQRVE